MPQVAEFSNRPEESQTLEAGFDVCLFHIRYLVIEFVLSLILDTSTHLGTGAKGMQFGCHAGSKHSRVIALLSKA